MTRFPESRLVDVSGLRIHRATIYPNRELAHWVSTAHISPLRPLKNQNMAFVLVKPFLMPLNEA